jgi:hypothetical protein
MAKPATFDAFCDEAQVPPGVRELLRPTYHAQPTLPEFFAGVREQLLRDPENPFISVVGPWVGDFIESRLRKIHHGQWVIPASAFQVDSNDDSDDGVALSRELPAMHGPQHSWCCSSRQCWGPYRATATRMVLSLEDLEI